MVAERKDGAEKKVVVSSFDTEKPSKPDMKRHSIWKAAGG